MPFQKVSTRCELLCYKFDHKTYWIPSKLKRAYFDKTLLEAYWDKKGLKEIMNYFRSSPWLSCQRLSLYWHEFEYMGICECVYIFWRKVYILRLLSIVLFGGCTGDICDFSCFRRRGICWNMEVLFSFLHLF